MSTPLKTPSVLAFERKLDPSDAHMSAGRWFDRENDQAWTPITLREKSVRGTISNRLKAKDADPAKLDASITNPNIQTVDVATLPSNTDTLRVQFTVRVLPGLGVPSACNGPEYRGRLTEVVQDYVTREGLVELANRYAANIANGRFLWRNRNRANAIHVVAELVDGDPSTQRWEFDALRHSLRQLSGLPASVQELGALVAAGLKGEMPVLIQVTAFVRCGAGQEVFPSQELILDKSAGKSKTLYEVGGVAAMHSQKVGNALRTIDTWYEGAEEEGPIAVETYGAVTSQGRAYRPKQKLDFYSLFDDWLLKGKTPSLEQQHYVIAMLLRGGVFGEAS